ncbi:hypothetical protein R7007_03110 [Vibrio sp. 1636]|uniref:Uncharacterized protein n=1 Tax=Vibrio alginolyticus TaxID=663 RepID=A0A7Y0QXW9_VIBAL|nr:MULTISPECIES: hypothetical protein [Vibrio]MDW2200645.1 hypothetical protein [Vibrio sp. 1636]NMR72606.1 hypothetical protein [Vibrio alginolyticus]
MQLSPSFAKTMVDRSLSIESKVTSIKNMIEDYYNQSNFKVLDYQDNSPTDIRVRFRAPDGHIVAASVPLSFGSGSIGEDEEDNSDDFASLQEAIRKANEEYRSRSSDEFTLPPQEGDVDVGKQ